MGVSDAKEALAKSDELARAINAWGVDERVQHAIAVLMKNRGGGVAQFTFYRASDSIFLDAMQNEDESTRRLTQMRSILFQIL